MASLKDPSGKGINLLKILTNTLVFNINTRTIITDNAIQEPKTNMSPKPTNRECNKTAIPEDKTVESTMFLKTSLKNKDFVLLLKPKRASIEKVW